MRSAILKIRVVPGFLKPSEIKNYFMMAEKYCKGCGCRLNYWANMPRENHAAYCEYGPVKRGLVSLEKNE